MTEKELFELAKSRTMLDYYSLQSLFNQAKNEYDLGTIKRILQNENLLSLLTTPVEDAPTLEVNQLTVFNDDDFKVYNKLDPYGDYDPYLASNKRNIEQIHMITYMTEVPLFVTGLLATSKSTRKIARDYIYEHMVKPIEDKIPGVKITYSFKKRWSFIVDLEKVENAESVVESLTDIDSNLYKVTVKGV